MVDQETSNLEHKKLLNAKYIENALKNSENDKNLEIHDFKLISRAENSGETFQSTVYRASVTFSTNLKKNATKYVIVKILHSKRNKYADITSFRNEIKVYGLIADMERLLHSNGEPAIELAPKLLFHTFEPQPVIVLEDLNERGYDTFKERLNFNETKLVLKKLAKFHAASVYLEKESCQSSTISNGLFNIAKRDALDFMSDNFQLFINELKTWPNCEIYVENLMKLDKKFYAKGGEIFTIIKNGDSNMNLLNHGDLNYKNLLFKRNDNGDIDDVLFIDFQLSVWATPAIDLMYTLYLLASDETRDLHRTELINYYYQEVTNDLTSIGSITRVPTLQDLHIELLKNGFLEVIISICFLPFLYVDYSLHTMDELINGDVNLSDYLYKNEAYQNVIKQLLPEFLFKGYLN